MNPTDNTTASAARLAPLQSSPTVDHNHLSAVVKPAGECPRCDASRGRWTRILVETITDEERRFNCTCTVEACDQEGAPGCGVCQAMDPEWPCPAESADV